MISVGIYVPVIRNAHLAEAAEKPLDERAQKITCVQIKREKTLSLT